MNTEVTVAEEKKTDYDEAIREFSSNKNHVAKHWMKRIK
jgi:hypothetical protein